VGSDKTAPSFYLMTVAIFATFYALPSVYFVVFGIGMMAERRVGIGMLVFGWGSFALMGAYDLVRRVFQWELGKKYTNTFLVAGCTAVSVVVVASSDSTSLILLWVAPMVLASIVVAFENRKQAWVWRSVILLYSSASARCRRNSDRPLPRECQKSPAGRKFNYAADPISC